MHLALAALESGAIDRDQLLAVVSAWAHAPEKPIATILAETCRLDSGTLERLQEQRDQVARRTGSSDATWDATVEYRGSSGGRVGPVAAPGERGAVDPPSERFQVLRLHAHGGLGEVFLAFDTELHRSVAVKSIQRRRALDPAFEARFLREAEITGSLEHPGVVPVYSLNRHPDGRPYYAMRLVEGGTLRDAIARFHSAVPAEGLPAESSELAFRRLLRSVIDACNAVAYAHSRNVVHRDLKPENIMLGRFGETLVVDWGLAKRWDDDATGGSTRSGRPVTASDAGATQAGSMLGTPRYMSPEQAAGETDRVGPASDVYSLGAILYCVLVGHDAFAEGDVASVLGRVRRGIFPAPRRVRRSVDPALEAICLKAMALDPGQRHASALELAGALEAWLADLRYRDEQQQAVSQIKTTLARLCLERAHRAFGRSARDEGLLWLARALESAPADPPELQRVIRTSLSAWHAGTKTHERRLRHGGLVVAFAFDPEGRRLATAGEDRRVQLWDLATGSKLAAPLAHDEPVRALAFAPEGARLATAGDDGSIRMWDALTGTPAGKPLQSGAPITIVQFNAEGTRLAAAGGPGGPWLWNTATGKPIALPAGLAGSVSCVAFSPDGSTLAAADGEGRVHCCKADTGASLGEPLSHGSHVAWLAFNPTGRCLLTGSAAGHVRLWDLERFALLMELAEPGALSDLALRPDGSVFATAGPGSVGRLWDSQTGRPIGERLEHDARVACLAFRPDGTILATGSDDGTLRFWCAFSGLPIGPAQPQGAPVREIRFRPDGERVAICGPDGLVRVSRVPQPVEAEPERIACWVRISTNLDFDPGDAIRRIDGPTVWDLRRRLDELGGAPFR
jgi:WD40 repeat protein/serine/threonine protein kinase